MSFTRGEAQKTGAAQWTAGVDPKHCILRRPECPAGLLEAAGVPAEAERRGGARPRLSPVVDDMQIQVTRDPH